MSKSILGGFIADQVSALGIRNGIENIHYTKIKEATKNRALRNIEELAEDIAEDGLEDNLVVRKIEDDDFEYELIAGHRRLKAIKYNIDHGNKSLEYIPCKVTIKSDDDAQRRLILNNLNADPLTPSEKLEVIEELKDIYKRKKERGEDVPGRIQSLIAQDLGIGKSQVANYEKIINNAIPEVRQAIEDGEITLTAASELSSMEDEDQLMFLDSGENMDIKTVKEFKENLVSESLMAEAEFDEEEDEEYDEPCYDIKDDYREEVTHPKKETIQDICNSLNLDLMKLKSKLDSTEFASEYTFLDEEILIKIDQLEDMLFPEGLK